jgi:transaldolase
MEGQRMSSMLEGLRRCSIVVADTGDLESIERFRPQDATTNPSLVLQAAADPRHARVLDAALAHPGALGEVDALCVAFGVRILQLIPGRVSTEVDARLSFDRAATMDRARGIIAAYEQQRVDPARVLVKIASTWEGIRAAEQLEREGIHCNLTLLFSFAQALACADAGVTLISPFVGRIYDWHCRARGVEDLPREQDPGVESVRRIYDHYKSRGIATQIMGASFRKITQVLDLAGCDLLTVSPALLGQLAAGVGEVPRRLAPPPQGSVEPALRARERLDEGTFRWQLNEDAMATEKLAEGIRRFHADALSLEQRLRERVHGGASTP